MDEHIEIIDTTLREGEQTPGVRFTPVAKRRIIDNLVKIGISEIELGIASRFHPCTRLLLEHCRKNHPTLRVSLWSRCHREDIDTAAALRPDILSLSIPVSDIHLEKRLGKDRKWALNTMTSAILYAKEKGLQPAIGFEDASRANLAFVVRLAKTAEKLGAVRIRLADTVGIAAPNDMIHIVRKMAKALTRSLVAVHTHNDFGMATANAIAALTAGARCVDTVILGLGERSGCASLEEVVGYLSLVKGYDSLHAEFLKPLAQFVANTTGMSIAGNRPILGDKIFTCETGLHLQGLYRDPATYEPYTPEKVGGKRHLLLGPKCGRRAIIAHLCEIDRKFTTTEPPESIIQLIRQATSDAGRPLADQELRHLLSVSGTSRSERERNES
jgi:homocitrate synthase NifV